MVLAGCLHRDRQEGVQSGRQEVSHMAKHSDTSQMKIRLEILPEKPTSLDTALAQEIGDEIFAYMKAQGYSIEPDYTGKMSGGVFGLLIAQFMENAGQAFMVVVAENVIDRLAEATKQIFAKKKPEERKEPPARIAINLPDGQGITVQGTLAFALKEASVALEHQKRLVVRAGQDPETTESMTITIKISGSHKHNHL
jgi:hypothetical protein